MKPISEQSGDVALEMEMAKEMTPQELALSSAARISEIAAAEEAERKARKREASRMFDEERDRRLAEVTASEAASAAERMSAQSHALWLLDEEQQIRCAEAREEAAASVFAAQVEREANRRLSIRLADAEQARRVAAVAAEAAANHALREENRRMATRAAEDERLRREAEDAASAARLEDERLRNQRRALIACDAERLRRLFEDSRRRVPPDVIQARDIAAAAAASAAVQPPCSATLDAAMVAALAAPKPELHLSDALAALPQLDERPHGIDYYKAKFAIPASTLSEQKLDVSNKGDDAELWSRAWKLDDWHAADPTAAERHKVSGLVDTFLQRHGSSLVACRKQSAAPESSASRKCDDGGNGRVLVVKPELNIHAIYNDFEARLDANDKDLDAILRRSTQTLAQLY